MSVYPCLVFTVTGYCFYALFILFKISAFLQQVWMYEWIRNCNAHVQLADDITRTWRLAGSWQMLIRMQQIVAGGHHDCRLESMMSQKSWLHQSIRIYLKEYSCQISSRSVLKQQNLKLFWWALTITRKQRYEISSWSKRMTPFCYKTCVISLWLAQPVALY